MTPNSLKASILQLAIQGRLVEQRPEEGTGEELYRQIQAEKQRLVKAGKLKKEKPLPEITEDEKPFEIPESWKWVKLNNLCCSISDGTHKTPSYVTSGIPFLSVKDISSGYLDFSSTRFISRNEHMSLIERAKPEKDDVLVCRIGTLGKAVKINTDVEFSIFVSLGLLKFINTAIADYVVLTINSGYGFSWIQRVKVGGGTHTYKINLDDLRSMSIPLPPLAEQKRIVAKIEELLPLIDRYAQAWSKLEDFHKRFPGDMQKSLLQTAIQGKLVEQRPEEGTGEELLKSILAAKGLKRSKRSKRSAPQPPKSLLSLPSLPSLPPKAIPPADAPFEIPESWVWVKLGDIAIKVTDGTHKTPHYTDTGVRFVSAKDLCGERLRFDKCKYISEQEHRAFFARCNPEKGDLLVSKSGSIGAVALVEVDFEFSLFESLGLVKYNQEKVFPRYLQCAVQAACINLNPERVRGVAVKHLPIADIKAIPIPLPPLAEQKRIVAKLEELLPLCERLK